MKKKPAPKRRNNPDRKRVFIVDDHPFLRSGLSEVLGKEPWLTIDGSYGTAEDMLTALATTVPDVVITDLTLPGKSGLDLVKDLAESHAELPVIVLSMHDEAIYAERCLRAGARGYLMKNEGADKLIEAVRAVLAGEVHVSHEMSARILKSFSGSGALKNRPTLGTLTEREFELFQLFGRGRTTQQIAAQLGLSAKTVETHRMHIKSKLGMHTAAELTVYAARWVETGNWAGSGNS